MSYEQNFLNDLLTTNNKTLINKLTVTNSKVYSKTHCDFSFSAINPNTSTQTNYYLEVKTHHSTNKFNNINLIFGNILKNRKFIKKRSQNDCFSCLLEFDGKTPMNSFFVNHITQYYNSTDWNKFGANNKCQYLFFYNTNTKELYYSNWKNFIKGPTFYRWL